MGLRFRKSFKLTSGLKLNVNKKSVSTSLGTKGLSVNTGTKGTFLNVGLPGTGISYRTKIFKKGRKTSTAHYTRNNDTDSIERGVMLGILIGAIVFWASGSFLLSFIPVFIIPMLLVFQKNTQEVSIHTEKISHTKDAHERYLKRQERVQQQIKRTIVSQEPKIKKIKKEESESFEEDKLNAPKTGVTS